MRPDPIVVPPDTTIREFLDDFVYRYHLKSFPVQDGSRLLGYISTGEVRDVEKNGWETVRVADVMRPPGMENTVSSNADSLEVFSTMNRTGNTRMIVRDGARLVGVVSHKDLLKFLALKLELNDDDLETGDLRRAA
jgi:predicted transcriptional regulator